MPRVDAIKAEKILAQITKVCDEHKLFVKVERTMQPKLKLLRAEIVIKVGETN